MKVLVNAFSARSGGGQTYLLNILRYIDEFHDAEIYILASKSLPVPCHPRLKLIDTQWPTENPLLRAVWEKTMLKPLLKRVGADILFCPGGLINTMPHRDCTTITMFRSMLPFDYRQRAKYPFGLKRARNWILEKTMLGSMQRADLVIFISDYARQLIQQRLRGDLKAAVTIPHGLDESFRSADESRLPRPAWLPEHEYILYVSIMDVYKNQLEVVRGYHLLKRRRQIIEKLLLVGYDATPYGARVRQEIERLGLQEDVIIAGNTPYKELPAVYNNAKVNLFASECENCPNILLEALGAGRPVLVSSYPPMPEFGGDAVLYFDPADPDDLADKLEIILDSPSMQDDLAAKAMKRSLQYDWKETAIRTWTAIREVHEKGRKTEH